MPWAPPGRPPSGRNRNSAGPGSCPANSRQRRDRRPSAGSDCPAPEHRFDGLRPVHRLHGQRRPVGPEPGSRFADRLPVDARPVASILLQAGVSFLGPQVLSIPPELDSLPTPTTLAVSAGPRSASGLSASQGVRHDLPFKQREMVRHAFLHLHICRVIRSVCLHSGVRCFPARTSPLLWQTRYRSIRRWTVVLFSISGVGQLRASRHCMAPPHCPRTRVYRSS